MRFSFKKACETIYEYFGKENVEQIWKPDGKRYYIVSVKGKPTLHIGREHLWQMVGKCSNIKFNYAP